MRVAKPKQPPSYDLKKQEHRRSQLIQIGLTAIVVIFAVALVGFIVLKNQRGPAGTEHAISVSTAGPAKLITKDGSTEPKVVLTLIEDPICPACKGFEQVFGPTVTKLIDTGAVRADYNMVAILDDPNGRRDYSSRASAVAYCVADQSPELFRKFHQALYENQPSELGPKWPDNAELIAMAKGVGASDDVSKCVKDKKYIDMVKGLGPSLKISSTPTIRINGKDWSFTKDSTPEDLIKAVTDITGPVPGLSAPAPAAPAVKP